MAPGPPREARAQARAAQTACDVDACDCVVPAACDTEAPLIVNSCTSACDTAADCPVRAAGLPTWTCDGTCRRPSDVLGPLAGGTYPTQWACGPGGAPVNLCGDGQHAAHRAETGERPRADETRSAAWTKIPRSA
ncbi:MAG: hypothetical protein IT374_22445 [Polyangiaceae bacterium]|nr:hypothetical protein [Polyangiaceae bacterium]